jgi:hypothetical protein
MTSLWESAYDEAQRRDGPLDFERSAAERALRTHLERRLAPLELAPLESTLEDLLARSAGADLVLASAVEAGVPGAEARLRGRVAQDLGALALKRGIVVGRVSAEVDAVLASVLAPPEHPHARTRLAAYDGSCTLVSWLGLALEERVLEQARLPAPGEAPPPPLPPVKDAQHPSANLLGGLLEGRLLIEEGRHVLDHARTCDRCRTLGRGLTLAGIKPPETPVFGTDPSLGVPRSRRRVAKSPASSRLGALLVSALVVAVIVVLAYAVSRGIEPWSERRRQDTEYEVQEAAASLGRSEPGLFADFEPYTREELARGKAPPGPAEGPEAAGPRPLLPQGRTLSTTPTFLWHAVPNAARYVLTVRDEDERVVWTGPAAGTQHAWPEGLAPLERGMPMTWEVVAEGAAEPGPRTRFSASPERDVIHWKRRVERLPDVLPDERVRAVFLAQLALRRDHVWEAWTAIREHVTRFPRDDYAALLLGYLQRVHGLPGA